jgi:hypothetical protein
VITERFERFYVDDMGALGVKLPDIAPRATEHVAEMIAMIARLIDTGNRLRRARPPRPRGDDRRRARRGRFLQEGPR